MKTFPIVLRILVLAACNALAACGGGGVTAPAAPTLTLSVTSSRTDIVGDWNTIALSTVTASGRYRAHEESRVMAMVNTAMSETINFNEAKGPSRYLITPARPLQASSEAAAAAAAHYVLVQLYPEQKARLDAALGRSLALVSDEGKRESGRIMGTALGMNIYAILSSDAGIGASEPRTDVVAARP